MLMTPIMHVMGGQKSCTISMLTFTQEQHC